MADLAELLRTYGNKIVNLPTEAQRFMVSPQSFIAPFTGDKMPEQTGFAAGFTGLPDQPPTEAGVLDPRNRAYGEGYNLGQGAGIAAVPLTVGASLPALLRQLPKKAAQETIVLDKIGQALENRRLSDYPSLVAEYGQLGESKGGKVLNTDIARELSPEYRANRTLSANVHEPASSFIKQYYAQKLAEPAKEGSYVLFTGGGTGAGKTTSLKSALPQMAEKADLIYDTNMNTLASADKKIQQALESGRNVNIVYTYRDPVEALKQGALTRAMRMKEELGTGRTVPLSEHMKTHIGSRDVIEELAKKYSDNPKVSIGVVDNSLGQGMARPSTLDQIPRLDAKALDKQLKQALQEEYKAGKISEDIYKGTLGGQ